jgi:hypothetical protein
MYFRGLSIRVPQLRSDFLIDLLGPRGSRSDRMIYGGRRNFLQNVDYNGNARYDETGARHFNFGHIGFA